jgi:two-component system response regulator AlgR
VKVLVVDDEPPARTRLRGLLAEIGGVEVAGEAGSGLAALELASTDPPDLVLLDVRMPGMDGLEVARHLSRLPSPPAVIFTTAYESHALSAFEVCAVDYLLKPVRRERLAEALARARQMTRTRAHDLPSEPGAARTHVSATQQGRLRVVPIAEVRYFLADQKYVSAGFPGGELLLEESLRQLEEELGGHFLRVHRNALVALAHVEALERDDDGLHRVRLRGVSSRLAVSRRLLALVRQRLRG